MCFSLRAADRRTQSGWSSEFSSLRGWDRGKQPTSVVTSIVIPALEMRAHYQTIVGTPHANTPASPVKSLSAAHTPRGRSPVAPSVACEPQNTPDTVATQPRERLTPLTVADASARANGLPVKKGILSITATVSSVSKDLELNPSLLEFIEQVVRPFHANIFRDDRVPSPVEDEDDGEDSMKQSTNDNESPATRPLSFPVDVCITFQMDPSKVYLTCNPHARVRCMIAIPAISFVMSFSLFSRKLYEHAGLSISQPESSLLSLGPTEDITMFNHLSITGCLQTFSLVLYTPQVKCSNSKLLSTNAEDKEAFNLLLGRAFIHLSRKSVFTRGSANCDVKSVDDYTIHQKMKVSGMCIQCHTKGVEASHKYFSHLYKTNQVYL